jgi:hypothetical protein
MQFSERRHRAELRAGNDAERGQDVCKPLKKYGRHEETRTPDLYRVKACRTCTYNNLHGGLGCLNACKYVQDEAITGGEYGA